MSSASHSSATTGPGSEPCSGAPPAARSSRPGPRRAQRALLGPRPPGPRPSKQGSPHHRGGARPPRSADLRATKRAVRNRYCGPWTGSSGRTALAATGADASSDSSKPASCGPDAQHPAAHRPESSPGALLAPSGVSTSVIASSPPGCNHNPARAPRTPCSNRPLTTVKFVNPRTAPGGGATCAITHQNA